MNALSRALRSLIVLAPLALLGACNVVMTKDPLFTLADEAGAPRMRPGVWLMGKDGDCKVDEKAPIDAWPECAGGGVVKEGEVVGPDKKSKGGWEHDPFILTAGDPRIMQIRVDMSASVEATASASGGATASASSSPPQKAQLYGYGGARATKMDAQGFIIAISYWPVMCGPPPPKNAKGEDVALGTLKPLPGMDMKPGDATCTTTSTAALRGAAAASKAWADKPMNAHWVRDGDR